MSQRDPKLAAFAPPWASIYRRCVGHECPSIRPVRNGTKVFTGLNILNACRPRLPQFLRTL
jgi:hypothetical protein